MPRHSDEPLEEISMIEKEEGLVRDDDNCN